MDGAGELGSTAGASKMIMPGSGEQSVRVGSISIGVGIVLKRDAIAVQQLGG